MEKNMGRRPKIGLALGSGSARGLAHIGVIRAIEEAGIEVDVVAGTSMGAFVGAIYASGNLDSLAAAFVDFDWKSIVSLLDPVFPRSGLIDGQKIADFVHAHASSPNIEDLPVPFSAVATDVMTGDEVTIGRGDLIEAVRASIAVPGIFTPVRNNGRILVDGGLVNPVPVSTARAMGANLIIAVDLNHDIVTSRMMPPFSFINEKLNASGATRMLESLQSIDNPILSQFRAWLSKEPLPGIFDLLLSSIYIMQARIAQSSLQHEPPEVLIQPPLGAVRFMEFERADEIIKIGYECAKEQLALFADARQNTRR